MMAHDLLGSLGNLAKRMGRPVKRRNQRMRGGRFRSSSPGRFLIEPLEPRVVLAADPLLISEFMAANDETLSDGDGNFSDWIEVLNPGAATVQLSNYFLTDDSGDLQKWPFPAISIDSNEYLVIFASAPDDGLGGVLDDYLDAGGNYHTNFQLAANGEYLAIIFEDPVTHDVSVVHEYAPEFPSQREDISYGIGQGNLTLVETGDAVRYVVPSDDSLGTTWTSTTFDESTWSGSGATLGVGYETNPQGGGVGQELTNLALSGNTSQSSVAYSGVPDNAIDEDYGNYTHTAAGVNLPSWWQVDLGDLFVLEELVIHNRSNCCSSRLRDITVEVFDAAESVVYTSELLNPENVLGDGVLNNGPATLDLDLVALNEGAPVIGQTIRITRTPDPDLSGSGGGGSGSEPDALSLAEVEVLGRDLLSYDQVYETDLASAMFEQNASVYLRVPFQMTESPTELDQLLLGMQYDDGFVAYLNGTPIAQRNAPGNVTYSSTATAERDDVDAIQFETIDVTAHLHLLQPGANVLAIHGLNLTADDDDFLIAPKLVGISTSSSLNYFGDPTPGTANNAGLAGFVADTQFSVDRGFYDTAFQLEVTSATPGAEIYYTTDGEVPSSTVGTLYTAPIEISGTTVLRAVAEKDGYFSSNADTHTYLFVKDVVSQDYQATLNAGFPTSWGGTSPDYGLDPDVIGNFDANGNSTGGDDYAGLYADTIQDDLKSLPTLSIVMNTDDLFGSNGIYTNSGQRGVAWERPTSVEWFHADGSEEFQVDAGIRIQGGAFRSHGLSKKHSFRLLFKDIYGPTKLNYPLFGEGAVDQFNTIVLRAGANDGYTWDAAIDTEQYVRDEFGRSLQNAMGNPGSHGNFAHLYINGIYWGLYNPVERPDNEFGASYISGDADNWDSIHVSETTAGDSSAWDAMFAKTAQAGSSLTAYMELQGKNLDGTPHATISPLLDVQNYVDYIALNVWGGNWDWPRKNFWAGRDRADETTTGFQFFAWDFENTMGNNRGRSPLGATTLDQDFTGSRNAGQPHTSLKSSAEYRMLFADRIHKFLFNDGVLTPDPLIERYQGIADQVELAMVAESARWGDTKHSTPQTLAEWTTERDWILNDYLVQRSNIVLQEFKDNDLYPNTVAPSYSQHGGQVINGFDLNISAPAGTIYYTLDGSDPRKLGGALSSTAIPDTGSPIEITAGVTVKSRVRSGAEWSALNEAEFVVATPADANHLRITELNFNPHDANPVPGLGEAAVDSDQFEFVELQNISSETIDLSGVKFVEVPDGADNEGITFTFPQQTLAAGGRVVIVRDQAAFESRYGLGLNVAGEYGGKLANGGELLTLRAANSQTIQQFEYDDSGNWPGRSDGKGGTLEVVNTAGDYQTADNWRSSNEFGGSPGTMGTGPVYDVIVNEVLSHSNGLAADQIELYNTTAAPIDLSRWFLSDTSNNLFQFQVSPGTTINAGQYLVLDELQFGFGLDGQFGDDVWLVAADNTTGKPLRFADHHDFDATDSDVSLGRWPNGDSSGMLFPMTAQTFGSPNSHPVLGDLLISEVHYNPSDVPPGEQGTIVREELEFAELYNHSGGPLEIDFWSVEGIGFTFPAGTSVAANEAIVMVTFDPQLEPSKAAAFRNVFSVDASARLFGPASGQLNNAGEIVKSLRPEDSLTHATGDVLVDAVLYDEFTPWPASADGGGDSLTRIAPTAFAAFATSWNAQLPTPGRVAFVATSSSDFDLDGDVDRVDLDRWQQGFGVVHGAQRSDGDSDADGDVDGADFLSWQRQYTGSTASVASAAPVGAVDGGASHFAAAGFLSGASAFADSHADRAWVSRPMEDRVWAELSQHVSLADGRGLDRGAVDIAFDELGATADREAVRAAPNGKLFGNGPRYHATGLDRGFA